MPGAVNDWQGLLENKFMGHVLVVFGTLIALNFGVGYVVSEHIYEDKENQGVVEVQEVPADQSEAAESTSPTE